MEGTEAATPEDTAKPLDEDIITTEDGPEKPSKNARAIML